MSKTLWKVKAKKTWNVVAKGMEVEIIVENRTNSKPTTKEIANALIKKYQIKEPRGMSASIFEFIKD